MASVPWRAIRRPVLTLALADVLAVGAGMGVPIFAILLGFPIGWIAPSTLLPFDREFRPLLRRCVVAAVLLSGLTLLMMLAIWGPPFTMLFDPAADLANFGIPMVLYEPRASFVGWMALMIVISPTLQALACIGASAVRLAWFPPQRTVAG